MIRIPISAVMPTGAFSIVKFSGKTYVTPAWVEVPEGTKLSDVEIVGKLDNSKPSATRTVHTVKGSRGDLYEVIIDDKLGNSCSCVGFQYHRNCKHIKQILNGK